MQYYFVYRILTTLLIPFTLTALFLRRLNGKAHSTRYLECLGWYKVRATDNRKLIWFNAVSVGELNSVIPIIKAIDSSNEYRILITTTTINSSIIAMKLESFNVTHQFAPLDIPFVINRFFSHWKPDVGIFIDSELWPNLIHIASSKIKLLLLNARLSDKSYKRWLKIPGLASYLYGRFSIITPTSQDDLSKVSTFASPKQIREIGDLKRILQTHNMDEVLYNALADGVNKRAMVLCASVHIEEMEELVKAHKLLKMKIPDLVTIIILRHPQKRDAALSVLEGLRYKSFYNKEAIDESTDVYLVDTLCPIMTFFHFASIVFLGGSLAPIGGHNLMEPASKRCALIVGPYISNIKNNVALFKQQDACLQVENAEELAKAFYALIIDEKMRTNMQDNALVIAKAQQDILTNALSLIKACL